MASPRISAGALRMAILASLSAAGPLSNDTYLPGLPDLARDLHISTSTAQLTLTASLAGLALGQLFAGPMSDRFGRRRPIIVGMTVFGLASLVCAITTSVPLLIAARFVQGSAGAAGVAVSRAVVRDLFSGPAMARYFSMLLAVMSVAPIVAPVLGGSILAFTSWRGIFVALTAVGWAIGLVAAFRLAETLPPERRHSGGVRAVGTAFARLVRDRMFVGYTLVMSLAFGAMFAYIAGSPFVVQDIYGASPQLFSVMFAINGLGILVVGRLAARLLGRFTTHQIMLFGCAQSATGALIVLLSWELTTSVWPLLVGLFLIVSCITTVLQNAMALALEPYPDIAGSASAVMGTMQFGIGALTSPLVGVAGNDTALPMALVMIVLTITGLAIGLAVSAAHRSTDRSPLPA